MFTITLDLNDQEIITIARAYSIKKRQEYDFQSVASVVQDHLRKNNFELFSKLREVLIDSDSFNKQEQTLSINDARCVIKGFKLPIPDYLLDMLLQLYIILLFLYFFCWKKILIF